MEKENVNNNTENQDLSETKNTETNENISAENNENLNDEKKEFSPEEEIINLKDKLARTFAEMENQRRRFQKERDDAFEYGGFSFAKNSY